MTLEEILVRFTEIEASEKMSDEDIEILALASMILGLEMNRGKRNGMQLL